MTDRRDNTGEELYDAMLTGLKAGRHTLRVKDPEKVFRVFGFPRATPEEVEDMREMERIFAHVPGKRGPRARRNA